MNLFKTTLVISPFLMCSIFSPINGFCAEPKNDKFESNLFQIMDISSFGVNPEKIEKLSAMDKKELLMAKDVLGKFFISIEKDSGNPNQYVSSTFLRGKTQNRQSIRKEIIADETDLLKIGITDFIYDGTRNNVVFNFYAIVFVEGTFSFEEGQAELVKLSGSWKISRIAIKSK